MNTTKLMKILCYVAIFGIIAFFLNEFLPNKSSDQNVETVGVTNGKQVVAINVTSSGFLPGNYIVKKDIPTSIQIKGINIFGCQSVVNIPKLKKTIAVKLGANEPIEFTPTETGTIDFACSMGMFRGTIKVI